MDAEWVSSERVRVLTRRWLLLLVLWLLVLRRLRLGSDELVVRVRSRGRRRCRAGGRAAKGSRVFVLLAVIVGTAGGSASGSVGGGSAVAGNVAARLRGAFRTKLS